MYIRHFSSFHQRMFREPIFEQYFFIFLKCNCLKKKPGKNRGRAADVKFHPTRNIARERSDKTCFIQSEHPSVVEGEDSNGV